MPLHYEAWVEALGEYKVEFPEALFYEFAGIPTARIIEILNERHGHNMPVQQTADYKEDLYVKLIPRVTPIKPVIDVIKHYSGKLPMAVATGGTRAIVNKTLGSLDLMHYFQAIVTADDVKHGKPAPDIFLEAARQIGVAANRCVAFEDADLGVKKRHRCRNESGRRARLAAAMKLPMLPAIPLNPSLQPFGEKHRRLIPDQLLRQRNIRPRIAHVSRARRRVIRFSTSLPRIWLASRTMSLMLVRSPQAILMACPLHARRRRRQKIRVDHVINVTKITSLFTVAIKGWRNTLNHPRNNRRNRCAV